jgi:sec-independent protein translocase protein TatB
MFDLGWQEFFLIATIAVIVVGPKDLPNVIRTVVGWIRKVRAMARDFQGSIEEVAREAELDEIRREAAKLNSQDLKQSILDTVDPDGNVAESLKAAKAEIEADTAPIENSMLNQDPVEDPSGAMDPFKDWDPGSVSTPASSVIPPAAEAKSAAQPAAAKAETEAKPEINAQKPRKTASKPRTAAKAETASKPKPATARKRVAAKPRKPRAAAKPEAPAGPSADKPASEA